MQMAKSRDWAYSASNGQDKRRGGVIDRDSEVRGALGRLYDLFVDQKHGGDAERAAKLEEVRAELELEGRDVDEKTLAKALILNSGPVSAKKLVVFYNDFNPEGPVTEAKVAKSALEMYWEVERLARSIKPGSSDAQR